MSHRMGGLAGAAAAAMWLGALPPAWAQAAQTAPTPAQLEQGQARAQAQQVEASAQTQRAAAPALPAAVQGLDVQLPLASGELGAVTLGQVLTAMGETIPLEGQPLLLRDAARLGDLVQSIYANRWLAKQGIQLKGQVQEPAGEPPSELASNRFWAEVHLRHEVEKSMPAPEVLTKLAVTARKANPAAYTLPADKKVSHMLLVSRNQPSEAVEAAARALLLELEAGRDFADLAKARSQDAGSAVNGGDLGWVMHENYPPAFKAEVARLQQPGQRSGVFRTDFGYHIVQLDDVRPEPRLMSDDEATAVMREQVLQRRNTEVRQRLWQQARSGVTLQPANIEQVVQAAAGR